MLAHPTRCETKGYRPEADLWTNTFNKVTMYARRRCLIKPQRQIMGFHLERMHPQCLPPNSSSTTLPACSHWTSGPKEKSEGKTSSPWLIMGVAWIPSLFSSMEKMRTVVFWFPLLHFPPVQDLSVARISWLYPYEGVAFLKKVVIIVRSFLVCRSVTIMFISGCILG